MGSIDFMRMCLGTHIYLETLHILTCYTSSTCLCYKQLTGMMHLLLQGMHIHGTFCAACPLQLYTYDMHVSCHRYTLVQACLICPPEENMNLRTSYCCVAATRDYLPMLFIGCCWSAGLTDSEPGRTVLMSVLC